jgi:hypothetical protein
MTITPTDLVFVLIGFILGVAVAWVFYKRRGTTRADALKAAHALFSAAMKLPGAADAKAEIDAQAALEKVAMQQIADSINKTTGQGG